MDEEQLEVHPKTDPTKPQAEADADAEIEAEIPSTGSTSKSTPQTSKASPSAKADQDASSDVSDEDDMPDYSILSSLIKKSKQQSLDASGSYASGITPNAHIPKRGEKDFEPTGVAGQNKALEKSRTAMLEAISAERRVASKALSFAIWDPISNRAIVHSFKGQMFGSIGMTVRRNSSQTSAASKPKVITTFELLPEEALYLIERGVLQCCIEVSEPSENADPEFIKFAKSGMGLNAKMLEGYRLENLVPMTVQEAFARILGKDECTRERYQVYAYCKRLGYIVQRASVTDEIRATVAATSKSGSTKLEPASERLRQSVRWITETVNRALKKQERPAVRGTGLLGIGGKQWDSFGHDRPHAHPQKRSTESLETAFPVFYHAWRPATHYKKSSPPLPEFRISIADARTTSLPDSFEFTEMFEQVPLPGELADDDEDIRIAKEQKIKNDEAYGRKAAAKLRAKEKERKLKRDGGKPETNQEQEKRNLNREAYDFLADRVGLLEPFTNLFHHLPPGCSTQVRKTFIQRPRPPNPFPALKSGRRNVILAVVDNGTTSMLRFGESEFEKWKLAGAGGQGNGK